MTESKDNNRDGDAILPVPGHVQQRLKQVSDEIGAEWTIPEDEQDAVGRTMFDTPQSRDEQLTVLMAPELISQLPSQSLVRIRSKKDEREYIGIVIEGPFAEPDGLRADAAIVVTVTVKGGIFMPQYHGRVSVYILGEVIRNGSLMPPRFRPLPNSPVYKLTQDETANYLQIEGDMQMGLVVGYEDLVFRVSSIKKSVFPRHLGILGTTGGGKSTTVSRLIDQAQQAGIAIIVFDTEGEYTEIATKTDDQKMLELLKARNLEPHGVKNVHILRLVGREGTNPAYKPQAEFKLAFDQLSPYMVMEILDLPEAQQTRYLEAYDIAKALLQKLKIYPKDAAEGAKLYDLDEMEQGYPRLTLQQMYDVVRNIAHNLTNSLEKPLIGDEIFERNRQDCLNFIRSRKDSLSTNVISWRALQGKLSRLLRLKIFDNAAAKSPDYAAITDPGTVTIIDLSDVDSPQIRNLALAELLRGLQEQQEINYRRSALEKEPPHRIMLIIEEAHEFLSRERIKQMPVLYQQVSRIAKRGRKRWFSLVFVTQSPQHLPDELLGLINSYLLHKISDGNVIGSLKRSIGKIDEGLWTKLTGLAPGQAVAAIEGLTRPLLVTIDPTPCKLRMID